MSTTDMTGNTVKLLHNKIYACLVNTQLFTFITAAENPSSFSVLFILLASLTADNWLD